MSTQQSFLVCDSSTLANFKQWASAISAFFATAGWSQAADTGQVNWSTIASVPGSGAYVYEVWQPNDGLTTFYLKVEYGNVSGTNCPSLRLSIGTGTNGSGTLTGFFTAAINCNLASFTAPSTSTQYECDFSGAAGRICVMMWRNGTNNCQQLFCVERSLNSSGSYTATYVTLYAIGYNGGGSGGSSGSQQSVYLGVGAGPASLASSSFPAAGSGGILARLTGRGTLSAAFNGSIPIDVACPNIGFFDYPGTVIGIGQSADITEGVTFSVTLYGSTRTYMPSKNGAFAYSGIYLVANHTEFATAMRYD
jgi:hypothetical protein